MSDFETWWQQEGQEFLYALNTTTDDDIKLVAEIAWKNGAYCAEQAEKEPVAWRSSGGMFTPDRLTAAKWLSNGGEAIPLYTHPVRTKDLTDDEIEALAEQFVGQQSIALCRAVIAADRSKNK